MVEGASPLLDLVHGEALRGIVRGSIVWFAVAYATCESCAFPAGAQLSQVKPSAGALTIDSLLHTPGPPWIIRRSTHFVVHLERGGGEMASPAIVNSLEAAWTYDTKLIGSPVPDAPPVAVFVTASRTRFSSVIPPHVKGLTMRMQTGEDFVILVHNDSVRAYSRHEVMHLVSFRAWGFPGPSATWLVEGVATFADGRCQGTTINAVARDILSQANAPTMQDVTHKFFDLMLDDRARAYVLAGTLTGYLWETRGVGAVKALWQGKDTLTALPTRVGSVGGAFLVDPAEAWRSYVRHAADTAAGISAASLRRFGCG